VKKQQTTAFGHILAIRKCMFVECFLPIASFEQRNALSSQVLDIAAEISAKNTMEFLLLASLGGSRP